MSESTEQAAKMDPASLYREDVFTDRRIGAIKRLTPVTPEGEPDDSRDIIYSGETQIMLGDQPLPINFELEAASLGEAAEKFADAAQKSAEETLQRLQEMRRDMASSIVVPGQEGMGGAGGAGGMGGPGGGKIRMP